ncbi:MULTISPECIES: SAF domain-containing protein [Paenibacillus]|uniref:SAF domain-containing protein n=1 Tax=Paenibacillus TaxID=44249 RepID=UPI00038FF5F9|nr:MULTISPECIES: SAF domain-containing protein [Paenibacillus]
MFKRNQKSTVFLAAALSAVLVYGLYQVQSNMLERRQSVQIVAPKRFIAAGERIAAEDLRYMSIPEMAFNADMMTEMGLAAGKEAIVPLGEGEPLRSWKMDGYRLMPAKNESTFQLPRSYVLSVSNGIRAGDRVQLYVSGAAELSERLFPEPVIVASVKTGGNQEIDDMDNPNLLSLASGDREKMYASRRDANGRIEDINLNLTEEQWLRIDSLCKSGESKLVVAYSPDSLNAVAAAAAGGRP